MSRASTTNKKKNNCDNNIKEKELEILLKRDWLSEPPYQIAFDQNEGKYLKATRDIKQGELILEECPIIRAPASETIPVCLTCYNTLDDLTNILYCQNCNFPFCSETCFNFFQHSELPEHQQMECKFFTPNRVKMYVQNQNYSTVEQAYDLILPLRLLSLKSDPERWKQIWKLMSHSDNLKKKKEFLERHKFVVDYILTRLKIPDVDEDLILDLLAIDHINGYTGDFNGYRIRLLHPLGSLLSHDCAPNVKRYYSSIANGNYLQCRASVNIQKGQKLTISYIDPLIPTLIRRQILKDDYFFDCRCYRCMDCTDLETNGNTIICQKCSTSRKHGYLRGLEFRSEWKCDKCGGTIDSSEATNIIREAYTDTMNLVGDVNKDTVEDYEAFVSKYSKILHPTHVLNIKIKSKLCTFYGKLAGYTMTDLSKNRNLVDKKLKYCKESLSSIEKIECGLSSLKGILFYEIYLASFILAQLKTDPNLPNEQSEEVKEELKKAFKHLEYCIEHLQFEQEGTFENTLCKGAVVGLLKSGYHIPSDLFNKTGHLKYSALGF